MAISFDAEAAALRYRDAELEELVRIVYVQPDNFVPQAVVLAQDELQRRGVDGASHPDAVAASAAAKTRLTESAQAADRPAHAAVLALSVIFADLFAIVAAILYSTHGRERAATQVWKAFGYGWLLRIVSVALFLLFRDPP